MLMVENEEVQTYRCCFGIITGGYPARIRIVFIKSREVRPFPSVKG